MALAIACDAVRSRTWSLLAAPLGPRELDANGSIRHVAGCRELAKVGVGKNERELEWRQAVTFETGIQRAIRWYFYH